MFINTLIIAWIGIPGIIDLQNLKLTFNSQKSSFSKFHYFANSYSDVHVLMRNNYEFFLVNRYMAVYLTSTVSPALKGSVTGAFPPRVAMRCM